MLIALVVFIFALLLFIPGVSPSVFGGDSGDIILSSWFAGVAHPPGYPINTIIGWIFTHAPFSASVAYKANLSAAFLQALAIAVLFLITKKITKNYFAATLGSLVLALNPLYWLYAHVYEVFQLNLVFLGFAVYFLLTWKDTFEVKVNRKISKKYLYLFCFFWGLSVFHHHTSILLGPAFFYLILKVSKKALFKLPILTKSGFFFFLGIVPYIFIPFAAARGTPINWNDPQNIKNLIRLITRADYGTFTAANFLVGSTLTQKLLQLLNYFLFLKSDFPLIGLSIIVLGAVYLFFKQRIIFWFVMLAIIFSGPFFLVFAGFPITSDFYRGLWERFLLTSYFFLAIFAGAGFSFIIEAVIRHISKRVNLKDFRKNYLRLLLSLSLFAIPFATFFINYPKADLSKFKLGDWLGKDILTSAEPNSLIFLIGDTALFNTQYIFYTNPENDNKKVIKAGSIAYVEYRKQVAKEYPDLAYPDEFFSDDGSNSTKFMAILMAANVSEHPIYIRDFNSRVSGYRWTNVGLLKKLEKESDEYSSEKLAALNNDRYRQFAYRDFGAKLGYTHFMTTHLKEYYYSSLTSLAFEFLSLGDKENAIKYADYAQELLSNKKEAYIILGNAYGELRNCDLASNNFEQVINIDDKDWSAYEALSGLFQNCFGDSDRAKDFATKAERLKLESNFDLKTF